MIYDGNPATSWYRKETGIQYGSKNPDLAT